MSKNESEKDLIKIAEDEGSLSLLSTALRNIDSILTGVLGTQKLELLMIPGRLVQAARNNKFLHQLAKEFEDLKEKGEIKDDYEKTEQATSCLQELLAALENPPVDEIKFKALKSIFLKAATEKISTRNDATPQLLMSVAKSLTATEILLLAAIYQIGKGKVATEIKTGAQRQLQFLAQNSQLSTTGLVEFTEGKLIEKRLISDRDYPDRSGVKQGSHFRLTDFGLKLCEYFVDTNEPKE